MEVFLARVFDVRHGRVGNHSIEHAIRNVRLFKGMRQIVENRGIRPNLGERRLLDVAELHVEVAAGLHVSRMADEDEQTNE